MTHRSLHLSYSRYNSNLWTSSTLRTENISRKNNMEIPHVNRWTAWSCVLYTFAAIPPSPSLGLFIPFFSLNKGYPGLAAMQAFLLHCLSLQALRRGAVKRRKGLVFRKMLHSGKIPKKFGQNLAKIQQKFSKIPATFLCWLPLCNITFSHFLTSDVRKK